ncbi:OmpA/MotB family protein [Thermodesulfovibrio hydrogeniphilus]
MRKRKKNDKEEENIHRWLISYSDFLTLLFTFFVALYALSAVDILKAERFTVSLRKVFKVMDKPIQLEEDRRNSIVEDLKKLLKDSPEVNITASSRGVVITLPNSLLFDSGSARLKPESEEVLTKIAEKLKEIPAKILIEGHTDNVPIVSSSIYKSNWELSAARAASVLHFMLEKGLSPDRFTIAGYGEYRPVESNETPEGRAKNRRVEIVIVR